MYGHDPADADRMYQEALQIIQMGLRGEPLTFNGEFYHFKDVPLPLEPVQKPHPPLWYGLHTVESAERAARNGYNMVAADPIGQAQAVATRFLDVWREAHGPAAREPWIGLNRFIVVAPTDAAAQAAAERAYPVWSENFHWLYRRAGRAPVFGERSNDFASASEGGRGIAGSPATVTAYLAEQLTGSNFNYLLGQFAFGDLTLEECRTSIDLFARHVMPALREAKEAA
jgi:alkanesulfonate monooxygenase SsuD/methylene tetrahydromethanopterin reductase-like flavin-dependent oxidoreductase (luciferase family)